MPEQNQPNAERQRYLSAQDKRKIEAEAAYYAISELDRMGSKYGNDPDSPAGRHWTAAFVLAGGKE